MRPFVWVAAVVLFLQLPIPLYWFVLHPNVNFWRRHPKASFIIALLLSWLPVTICIFLFRRELFRQDAPPLWSIVAGLILIFFEGWLFWRLSHDLGATRLIGKAELSGSGEMARHGIYAYIRHPRYAGSFLAILGACLLAGTRVMWIVAPVWCILTLIAIGLEERELHVRFGAAYEEYSRQVPRFMPCARGFRNWQFWFGDRGG
ncbi:MAG: methyltransferase family protein [Candidatus Acidiferrales bacterium]